MKISTKHKQQGDTVEYLKGFSSESKNKQPDIIYISTMFTYYSKQTIDCINHYSKTFPAAEIQVGGIFATLMPDYIEKKTGIKPFLGYSDELDHYRPDYNLVPTFIEQSPKVKKWKDYSILFSTRGCPRSCGFCAVKTLEPDTHIIENWQNAIDLSKPYVMFQDNNLTAFPFEHFKKVMEFIRKNGLKAHFNNGFDARKLTSEQIELMSQIKWAPAGLRLAFDNMTEDGYVQRAVDILLKKGIAKDKFLIFCMYNFKDTLEEAMYRCNEMKKLGVRPFPQCYYPLDSLEKKAIPSKHWTEELISSFRQYWFLALNYKHKTWEHFLAEETSDEKVLVPIA
jgi:hypothetical protein